MPCWFNNPLRLLMRVFHMVMAVALSYTDVQLVGIDLKGGEAEPGVDVRHAR